MINSSDKKNTVLVIAYGFPPAGGSTVVRVLKFCKYLPRYSWKPVVVTVNNPRVLERDPGLIHELPDSVKVYRTPTLELPISFYNGWASGHGASKGRVRNFTLKRFLSRMFRKLRYALMVIDERIGWVPFVIFKGWRLCGSNDNDIKVIYVAVKPFSLLLAAIALKKITRLPLVIDFHDGWVSFNPYFWSEKPAYLCRLEKAVEKKAVGCADRIISVNENIIWDFRSRYPEYPADKFISICNGYDADDFSFGISVSARDKFTITYAGSLYAKRSPENFLKALKMLIQQKPALKNNVRFCYIGKISVASQGFFQDDCINDLTEFTGMLTHKECAKRLMRSDLLLFIEDQVEISRMLLPTKVFEYVASGRPILALASEGPTADLILKSKSGIVLSNSDISGIRDALDNLISDSLPESNQPVCKQDAIKCYSHEAESGLLSQVFNNVIS